MNMHLVLLVFALIVAGSCKVTAQDAVPVYEPNTLLSNSPAALPQSELNVEVKSVNAEQIDPSASHPDEKVVDITRHENDIPLSRKAQNLESFQEETRKKIGELEAEQEFSKVAHLKTLEALHTSEAEAQASDQANIDRLNAANQLMIDALHEEQVAAEKKFKSQQAKISALEKQNQALMIQLGSFFESESAAKHANNSKDNKATGDTSILKLSSTGGVTYIRWGRTVCDTDATVFYEGFGGTSYYTDVGGGSEILCLHSTPRLDTSIASIAAAQRATISGIEYGFVNTPFSYVNNCGQTFIGSDMPCAVCHVQTRTEQIMIPARDTCPIGWTLEYWGFLVSSYSSHTTLAYTCLDNAPESIPGSFADTKSRFVYPIESICGASLPCPPYVAGFAVPCVVCSK